MALCVFSNFWYQTLDAVDGKQARRTDNCSPLGQILDHNLDQLTQTCFMIAVLGIVQSGPDIWTILAYCPGVMSMHYLVEYRTHFTNFHQIVVGGIGATEQLCIIMSVCLVALFFEESSAVYQYELFEVMGYPLRGCDLILIGSFLSGFFYNLDNL